MNIEYDGKGEGFTVDMTNKKNTEKYGKTPRRIPNAYSRGWIVLYPCMYCMYCMY